ncbi:MAG: hypothetical protein C4311_09990 [Chloroflexota bacterium]
MVIAPTAESVLPDETRQRLEQIGTAEIVVGIPGYYNVDTLRHVIETATRGLAHYFPGHRALVFSVASSTTHEMRALIEGVAAPAHLAVLTSLIQAGQGRGMAVHAVLEAMARLGAQAGALLNSDVPSITPAWLDRLIGPVLRDRFDFVAPNYVRHRHAGTLNDLLVYPLTRALYGIDLRHPMGGECGFSADLAHFWLAQPVWQDTDVARSAVDIWMATTAVAEGFRIAQANLGVKRRDRRRVLPPREVFHQVMGTLFDLMERYADRWQAVKSSALKIPPFYGDELCDEEPEPVPLDVEWMFRAYLQGMHHHAPLINRVLAGESILPPRARSRAHHHFPPELWAPAVYRFALADHRGEASRGDLLDALMALYYGRVSAALWENQALNAAAFEQLVIRFQAGLFQVHKHILTYEWERR